MVLVLGCSDKERFVVMQHLQKIGEIHSGWKVCGDLHERGDCIFGPHASEVLRSRCQLTEPVSLQQPYLGLCLKQRLYREGEDAKNVVITSLTFSAKALQVIGLADPELTYYFSGLLMDSINSAGEE